MTSTRAGMRYHSVEVDGLDIFNREAGPSDAPVSLLLHGFPSSSRISETLTPLLAQDYRLIASDQCAPCTTPSGRKTQRQKR